MAGSGMLVGCAAPPPALKAGSLSKMADLEAHLRQLSEEQYVKSYYKVRPAGEGAARGIPHLKS